MKLLKRTSLFIVVVVAVFALFAWILGALQPVSHVVSVSDEVHASPDKTWSLITGLDAQPKWRTGLQSIEMLPPEDDKQHWREHLSHGQTMTFVADESIAESRRVVRLDQPGASYTGAWTCGSKPSATPGWTSVTITEAGDIHPALYRFLMHYVIGPRKNLDQYMSDLKAAATGA